MCLSFDSNQILVYKVQRVCGLPSFYTEHRLCSRQWFNSAHLELFKKKTQTLKYKLTRYKDTSTKYPSIIAAISVDYEAGVF